MDRKRLRVILAEREKRLVDVHRATGISYNRLVRVANGYSEPTPEEIAQIAAALGIQTIDLQRQPLAT